MYIKIRFTKIFTMKLLSRLCNTAITAIYLFRVVTYDNKSIKTIRNEYLNSSCRYIKSIFLILFKFIYIIVNHPTKLILVDFSVSTYKKCYLHIFLLKRASVRVNTRVLLHDGTLFINLRPREWLSVRIN